jgi:hypothetical protein
MTPQQAADIVEAFARRYVAERDDPARQDSVKAQGWAILQAAHELRRTPDTSTGAT